MEQVKSHIYHSTLKKRPGWSEKVIAHFFPQPCAYGTNPHYRSAAMTKLYTLAKVEAIEATDAWQQQAAGTNKRKEAAGMATATKRAGLLAYVEGLRITVPAIETAELTDLACAHYNARRMNRRYVADHLDWREATPESDTDFLKRITTNYLRHMLTRYEKELTRIVGKVGVDEAYEQLKSKVNEAIYQQYPHLR